MVALDAPSRGDKHVCMPNKTFPPNRLVFANVTSVSNRTSVADSRMQGAEEQWTPALVRFKHSCVLLISFVFQELMMRADGRNS